MIKSFKNRETEKIFRRLRSRRLPQDIQRRAYAKLIQIHHATTLQDLDALPGNRLERLKGNRKEQYSIRINNQWRICFNWETPHAFEVEIIDYH